MIEEFKNDIEIKVEINRAEGTIRLSDSLNKTMVNFMNTKEKAVRDALISLGWTLARIYLAGIWSRIRCLSCD